MSRFLHKIFLIATSLIIASCGFVGENNQQPQMRIVDLQGNPRSVKMRTPELNMQALAAQGNLTEDKIQAQPRKADIPQENAVANNKYNNDFGAASSDAIKNTLQLPTDPQKSSSVAAPEINEADILTAGSGANTKDVVIEYNLNKDNKTAATPIIEVENKDSIIATKQKGIFVQTGSFTVLQHAKNSLAKIEKFASKTAQTRIEEAQNKGKTVYRVLIGPFSNKQKAAATVAKLIKSGNQAIIVKNK